MVDRVQVVKWESPGAGGTEDDFVPTEIDPNEDGVEARASFLQNDTSSDTAVEVSRDASDNMTFKDGVVVGTKTLTDLLTAGDDDDQVKIVIEALEVFTVKEDHQHIFYDTLIIDGQYIVEGQSVALGGEDVQALDRYDPTGGTDISSGWTDVPLSGAGKQTALFQFSGAEATVGKDCCCHTTWSLGIKQTSVGSRSDGEMRLMVDEGSGYAEVPGSRATIYSRLVSQGKGTSSRTRIFDFEAGWKIKIQARRLSGSGVLETEADESGLVLLRCG